jgi:hypothetical protein
MPHPFDVTLKEVVAQHPADFVHVFELPEDQTAHALNVDLSTLSAASDVALGFGDPIKEIVDINLQSGPDPNLPARLLLYNAAIHLRYGVPVGSLAVLLRPKAEVPLLTGKLAYASGGMRVEFEYTVVRMWQQSPDIFLHGGIGLLPLATLCKMPNDKTLIDGLREVVGEIDGRLGQEPNRALALRLMAAAFILTGMRVSKDALANVFSGVRIMQESTAYDMLVDEIAKGQIRLLLRQGRKRFGPPYAKIEAALSAIRDLDRLERIADTILTVNSWEELLATP